MIGQTSPLPLPPPLPSPVPTTSLHSLPADQDIQTAPDIPSSSSPQHKTTWPRLAGLSARGDKGLQA